MFLLEEKENKKSNKDFSKNDKGSLRRTKHGQFKRKLGEDGGSKAFVKKRKTSGPGEQNKGKN